MNPFPGIRIEGGLFGPDFLEQVLAGDLPGQAPEDFGLPKDTSFKDQIAKTFMQAQERWALFTQRRQRANPQDSMLTLTRQHWVNPFLRPLGYELRYQPQAQQLGDLRLSISDWAGPPLNAPPVHIVPFNQSLDRLPPSGQPRLAPHTHLQEFLNRTEYLWGLLTNGAVLRLLRDSTYLRRQAYVEFDLVEILERQRFEAFELLYRLLHRTRLPQPGQPAADCLLEKYYQLTLKQGERVRERLRYGVERALRRLAEGFLEHPANTTLRQKLQKPAPASETSNAQAFYQQLLRLVYRLLFLLVSEERGLISSSPLYHEHYSVSRLRRLLHIPKAYNDYDDLWHSLQVLRITFNRADLAPFLGVAPLNGELFARMDLDESRLSNRALLEAFWYLAYYQEREGAPPRRVHYAALDVEELGSVYESLLDYQPLLYSDGGKLTFSLMPGYERKTTGSYYTPPQLVQELLRTTLEPVVEERLKQAGASPADQEKALLSLRVLDPACGSGHFLLAAARYLGKKLAQIRNPHASPAPEELRQAVRDVVSHCLYGVDKNPLAVELCRVALWIETHIPQKPLTFLNRHIQCGDSLVGVLHLHTLKKGIPDHAFQPLSHDDHAFATSLKRRNQGERTGQLTFFFPATSPILSSLALQTQSLENIAENTLQDIQKKQQDYENLQRNPKRQHLQVACDLWTAAFFQPLAPTHEPYLITTEILLRHLAQSPDFYQTRDIPPPPPQLLTCVQDLSTKLRFFHWPLEFPEFFPEASDSPQNLPHHGFDVILSNPPWEQIQLEEQQFFDRLDPHIANAPNASERKKRIQNLAQTNPHLYQQYQEALRLTESLTRYFRHCGQYPLATKGRLNTYALFAERILNLLSPKGRAGLILPTGIATDTTNQTFLATLLGLSTPNSTNRLVSLFDFENREGLFSEVHRSYRFCLLTFVGPAAKVEAPEFVFFAQEVKDVRNPIRRFSLSPSDIARFNPNTLTLPAFRTRQDAELSRVFYPPEPSSKISILLHEPRRDNPWKIQLRQGLFNMSTDSHLFRTSEQLEREGYRRLGSLYVRGDLQGPNADWYAPLYEAKMIWYYHHRYGTYAGRSGRGDSELPTPSDRQLANSAFTVQPRYWVPHEEVQERLKDWPKPWVIGWRDITNVTNERTAVFTVLPRVGIGNNIGLLLPQVGAVEAALLLANLASLPLDWVARQKVGGVHLSLYYLKQLPVIRRGGYGVRDVRYVVGRVVELVYVAWDVKGFADEVWGEADGALREVLMRRWRESWEAMGGEPKGWEAPEWLGYYGAKAGEGFPLPPFPWNPERRAQIQAELDTYYAYLYGLSRKQLRYILDPADLTKRELESLGDAVEEVGDALVGYEERRRQSDFPGETFRVLREKERKRWGEYRTRRLVLEAWERLVGGGEGMQVQEGAGERSEPAKDE
jgi:hypothetical protein